MLTVLVKPRSACSGVSVALPVLLPGSGSNWSEAVIVAVLVWGSGLSTRAFRISVRASEVVTVGMDHKPVAVS